jgi:diguanylate cyclase (GGDEF)-like protein
MAELIGTLHEFVRIFTRKGRNLSLKDPRIKADFYYMNLPFGIAVGVMICGISLIAMIGTYAPFAEGYVLAEINATWMYILIFGINLVFSALLFRELKYSRDTTGKRAKWIFNWFISIDMVLASFTFYTTQAGSSFFFEYILVTIACLIIPNVEGNAFIRCVVINVCAMIAVLCSARHEIAWQDVVDIVALFAVCGLVNWVRWLSFLEAEETKFKTENKRDEFYRDSRTDELTGLRNRAGLRDDFSGFLGIQVCAALLDLDSFKIFNDTYGHAYGDEVLRQTGRKMLEVFGKRTDRCYRYGGDEFLILSATGDVTRFAQKLARLHNLFEQEQNGIKSPCSIGFAMGRPGAPEELRTLIRIADNNLYSVKNKSAGRIKGSFTLAKLKNFSFSSTASVLESLRHEEDAVALFQKEHLENKAWDIGYLDIYQYGEIVEEFGSSEGKNILTRVCKIILRHFPDTLLINREIDHFVLYSELSEEEFISRIRRVQEEAVGLEERQMIILGAGVCRHEASEPPMDFITGMFYAKYASNQAWDLSRSARYLCVYDSQMAVQLKNKQFVHNTFSSALEEGHIVPYYQPIIGSLSGTTCGYEALSRWIDPERGVIPPADFVPVLEHSGEICRLDLSILEQVCRDIRDHRNMFPENIFVNVNLSQRDFQFGNMAEEIFRIVSAYGISSRQVQLEITESAFADSEMLSEALSKLEKMGFQIWMDDFGVGESSLSALRYHEIVGVKLDQSFFADIENRRAQIIIRSVIDLSHDARCKMIAEGIENREQLRFAQEQGINFIQGFYFSRPLPLAKLLESSFAGNLTDDGIDRYYESLASVYLKIDSAPDIYLKDGTPAVFGNAVIEIGHGFHILRMNDQMKSLLCDDVQADGMKFALKENSGIASVLRTAAGKVRACHGVCNLRANLEGQTIYGQLSFLAEDPERGKTAFILHLSNLNLDLLLKGE